MSKNSSPILIGIGANLPSRQYGSARATCEAALKAVEEAGVDILGQSGWYKSAPVPVSSQPWYINGVISVQTTLTAQQLLALLNTIEERFGRVRTQRNAARTLDLDLLAYGDLVTGWDHDKADVLTIPHRRMNVRGFVLLPLREIVADWFHPVLHMSLDTMIAALDPDQQTLRDD